MHVCVFLAVKRWRLLEFPVLFRFVWCGFDQLFQTSWTMRVKNIIKRKRKVLRKADVDLIRFLPVCCCKQHCLRRTLFKKIKTISNQEDQYMINVVYHPRNSCLTFYSFTLYLVFYLLHMKYMSEIENHKM